MNQYRNRNTKQKTNIMQVIQIEVAEFTELFNTVRRIEGDLRAIRGANLVDDTQGLPENVSTTQAAERLGVTKVTLWKWKKEGKLIPFKIGGRNYYKRRQIIALTSK